MITIPPLQHMQQTYQSLATQSSLTSSQTCLGYTASFITVTRYSGKICTNLRNNSSNASEALLFFSDCFVFQILYNLSF